MKTNYVDMSKRYALAHQIVWAKLAKWKQNAITEDRVEAPNTSRHIQEFTKEVIRLAESTEELTLNPTIKQVKKEEFSYDS